MLQIRSIHLILTCCVQNSGARYPGADNSDKTATMLLAAFAVVLGVSAILGGLAVWRMYQQRRQVLRLSCCLLQLTGDSGHPQSTGSFDCIHALKGVCRLAAITELRRHGPTMAIGNLLYRGC